MKKFLVLASVMFSLLISEVNAAGDEKELFKIQIEEGDMIKQGYYSKKSNYKNPAFFGVQHPKKTKYKVVVSNDGDNPIEYSIQKGRKTCHHKCHHNFNDIGYNRYKKDKFICYWQEFDGDIIAQGVVRQKKEKTFEFSIPINSEHITTISGELHGKDITPPKVIKYYDKDFGREMEKDVTEFTPKEGIFSGKGSMSLYKVETTICENQDPSIYNYEND